MKTTLTRRVPEAIVLVAIFSVVLSFYPSLHADQITRKDSDDVPSFLDITRVKHEHEQLKDGRRRIRHTITMHESWSARRLFPRGCADLSISIDDPGRYIRFYWDGKLKAKLGRRQLAAWRPNRRSVTVRVRPRLLAGDDRSYRWRARSLATDDGSCDGGERAWEDYAPSSRWIRHELV